MNQKKHREKYLRLGLNVAYYRKLKRMTQERLAEQVNASRTHISNLEAPNVQKGMSLEMLFDIADALEIESIQLFEKR